MNIGILTDSHFGFNPSMRDPNIDTIRQLKDHDPDIILHCGDVCLTNYLEAQEYWKMVRSFFPDTPIGTVLGNHDYWDKLFDTIEIPIDYLEKYEKSHNAQQVLDKHKKVHKEFNITHLSNNMEITVNNVKLAVSGFDGWYSDPVTPFNATNDHVQIPNYGIPEGHEWLLNQSDTHFNNSIKYLNAKKNAGYFTVLVTHFGFTEDAAKKDWKSYNNSYYFGNQPEYESMLTYVDYLCFGHSHTEHTGFAKNGHTHILNVGGTYKDPMSAIMTIEED